MPEDLKQLQDTQPPQYRQTYEDEPIERDEDFEDNKYQVAKDSVEGTKNFDKAYDKLVKKFYNEEGANLLIPQEDMMIHEFKEENKVVFNIEERQKKYAEQERKK